MIDFSDKTFENILSDMLGRVDDNLNKRDGSLIKTSLSAAAWAIEGIYLNLAHIQSQAYANTAIGENLDYIAGSVGLDRKEATKAQWYVLSNAPIPIGTILLYPNSDESVYFESLDESEEIETPEDPDLPYRTLTICQSAGSDANDFSGSLQTVDFVSGLTSVVLDYISIPGSDEETDDSLRERYFQEVGAVEFGGNMSSYRTFIKTIGGVGAVQVFPVWNGAGTVLCSVLSDSLEPITADKISEIQNIVCPPYADDPNETPSDYGFGMAPIGASVTITTAVAHTVVIVAQIQRTSGTSRTLNEIIADIKSSIKDYIHTLCSNWENLSTFNSISYSVILYYNKILGLMSMVDGVDVVVDCTVNGTRGNISYTQNASLFGQNIPKYVDNQITITEV